MCQRRVGKERQPAHLTSGVVLQTFGRDPQIGEDAAVSWPKAAEEGEDQERSEWSIAGVRKGVFGGARCCRRYGRIGVWAPLDRQWMAFKEEANRFPSSPSLGLLDSRIRLLQVLLHDGRVLEIQEVILRTLRIFIGGISRALSSDMLMEIAAAFGPLKAYRFQVNEDLVSNRSLFGAASRMGHLLTLGPAKKGGSRSDWASLLVEGGVKSSLGLLKVPLAPAVDGGCCDHGSLLVLTSLSSEEKAPSADAAKFVSGCRMDRKKLEFSSGGNKLMPSVAGGLMQVGPNPDAWKEKKMAQYVDQSVTLKACAGLNGMKLGGQVLTVVQAIPNALAMENTGNLPFYGIPEHAKPLLERPTQVLKLKNVVNPDDLSSLSEAELEEILEDIRLECTRFGTVKSVNIVKYNNSHVLTWVVMVNSMKAETLGGGTDDGSSDISGIKPPTDVKDLKEVDEVVERNGISDDKSLTDLIKNELCEPSQIDSNTAVKEPGCPDGSDDIPRGLPDQLNNMKHEVELRNNKAADVIQEDIIIKNKLMTVEELKLEETNRKLLGTSAELDSSPGIKSDFTGKNDSEKGLCNLDDMFEVGCVLVEYGRTEASCMAAHCLHGRYFDDRVVVVGYVALDLYRMKFPR
uniref:Uncharacterized protein n=1 Tax=Vitis vinifera TaxID=29760 RepID=A5AX08_VITVI|nr:hypothetical protein VITISV_036574 [Vitis vinifera]